MKRLNFRKLYQKYRIWLRRSKTNECRWIRFNHEFDYETDCSHYYEMIEPNGQKQTRFDYCPFCGKPMVEEVLMDCGSF